MQKILLIIVGAIVLGGGLGVTIYAMIAPQKTTNSLQTNTTNTVTTTQASDVPDPSDFLSMRPELESLPAETLSTAERDGLIVMREEEKLARDVYTTLGAAWGTPIFSNISQSEQTHTESVRALLVKYAIPDPVTSDTVGDFTNVKLGRLYVDLVARGKTSLVEALTVGALIEDLDIADLQKYLATTDNQDIRLVYDNLTKGSRNHIRSFTSQLTSRGASYTPTYITQTAYDAIIAADRETGTGTGATSQRRGWGGQ